MYRTSYSGVFRAKLGWDDGAMGTQLMLRGLTRGECGMRGRCQRRSFRLQAGWLPPDHDEYLRGHPLSHGLGDQVSNWNRMAAALARATVGSDGFVFGDVGPFGDFLDPLGDATADQLQGTFSEQIAALVEGGADAIPVDGAHPQGSPSRRLLGRRYCGCELRNRPEPGRLRNWGGSVVSDQIQGVS